MLLEQVGAILCQILPEGLMCPSNLQKIASYFWETVLVDS